MSVELPLDHEAIKALLPHRYPFLLVDRVTDYKEGESVTAYKNVSGNEEFFNGHFPNKAIMPGVLITEALAQVSAILGFLTTGNRAKDGYLYLFAGLDNVRFKRQVVPGDQLQLTATLVSGKQRNFKFSAKATVDGELCCSADILCAERKA